MRWAIRVRCFLVLLLPLLALSRTASGEISKVATQVQLTISKSEISAGDTASITITLRDPDEKPVVTHHPVTVEVRRQLMSGSQAPEKFQLEIRPGTSSVTEDLSFQVPGTFRVRARALHFPPATALLAVKEPGGPLTDPRLAEQERVAARLASQGPLTGVYLYVPAVVHPKLGVWSAQVFLVATGPAGKPQSVTEDLLVHLHATKGEVTPASVVIQAGYSRSAEAIQLTSVNAGLASVVATPEGLPPVKQDVEYQQPEPAKVGIIVQPVDRRDDSDHSFASHTTASVTVMLLDEMGHATPAPDGAMEVIVDSTRGQLHPSLLRITKGNWRSSEAQLTSFAAGEAVISASAPGVADGKHTITFRFPWLLLLAATLGGLVGAFIRDINSLSRDGVRSCWRHLVVGLVMGAVVYGLSLFGALGTIAHRLEIVNVEAIPTANHFGAMLLGFLGGYFGRRLLKLGPIGPLEKPNSVRPASAGT